MKSTDITDIIYDTARGLHGIDDRMSIAALFIFCYSHDSELFAELLYTNEHRKMICRLNEEYANYEIDFTVRLDKEDVKRCFLDTIEKARVKFDADGFHKALFDKDPYAIAVRDIINAAHFTEPKRKSENKEHFNNAIKNLEWRQLQLEFK